METAFFTSPLKSVPSDKQTHISISVFALKTVAFHKDTIFFHSSGTIVNSAVCNHLHLKRCEGIEVPELALTCGTSAV